MKRKKKCFVILAYCGHFDVLRSLDEVRRQRNVDCLCQRAVTLGEVNDYRLGVFLGRSLRL